MSSPKSIWWCVLTLAHLLKPHLTICQSVLRSLSAFIQFQLHLPFPFYHRVSDSRQLHLSCRTRSQTSQMLRQSLQPAAPSTQSSLKGNRLVLPQMILQPVSLPTSHVPPLTVAPSPTRTSIVGHHHTVPRLEVRWLECRWKHVISDVLIWNWANIPITNIG